MAMETKARKQDRRQIRTRRRIRETFMTLIMEKPMEKITIKELAERADIDRKTFYLHYSAINQVLDEIQDDLVEKLRHVIAEYDLLHPSFDALQFFQGINSIIDADGEVDLYRRMLKAERYSFFYGKLKDAMKALLQQRYLSRLEHTGLSLAKLDLYSEYVISGILGIYVEWLRHPEYNLDEVAETATEIFYDGGRIVRESLLHPERP